MRSGFVPSYKAIACAILKNDLLFHSLGFPVKKSAFYDILKKIEIEERTK
jgi:predicted phosphoadenosine phosphosulfate sulfurtransferase